jgi:hypothetical protein
VNMVHGGCANGSPPASITDLLGMSPGASWQKRKRPRALRKPTTDGYMAAHSERGSSGDPKIPQGVSQWVEL